MHVTNIEDIRTTLEVSDDNSVRYFYDALHDEVVDAVAIASEADPSTGLEYKAEAIYCNLQPKQFRRSISLPNHMAPESPKRIRVLEVSDVRTVVGSRYKLGAVATWGATLSSLYWSPQFGHADAVAHLHTPTGRYSQVIAERADMPLESLRDEQPNFYYTMFKTADRILRAVDLVQRVQDGMPSELAMKKLERY